MSMDVHELDSFLSNEYLIYIYKKISPRVRIAYLYFTVVVPNSVQ